MIRDRRFMKSCSVAVMLLTLAACGSSAPPTASGPVVVSPPVYVPGVQVAGRNDYVLYVPGNLPVIFSAPHGGTLQQANIPVRVEGAACGGAVTTPSDLSTEELVRSIQAAFLGRTGGYPHIVISRLHRSRLDPNRDSLEAACGNADALAAWREYHGFIAAARSTVTSSFGRGFYTDIHGHGHAVQRLELGYELSATTLRRTDAELDADPSFEASSSIRFFSGESPLRFSEALRGATALGTLLASAGFPSTPSRQDPAPAAEDSYFNGGFSTERYGCRAGGTVCSVQIESNYTGVRDTQANRDKFAAAIVSSYMQWLPQFGITVAPKP